MTGAVVMPHRRATRLVNQLISMAKGRPYEVDPQIPASYLVVVLGERGLMQLRGSARFPSRRHKPFLGPRAHVRASQSFTFGPGATIGPGAVVDALSSQGVTWGRNVTLGRGSRIECTGSLQTLGRGMTVGDDVGLGTDAFYGCAGGILIGSHTIIGNYVSMHAENHVALDTGVPIREQGVTHQGIEIGEDCWIGAKATILDGVRLGRGSIVAAGAVLVTGSYPDHGIYGGVPARLIGRRGLPAG